MTGHCIDNLEDFQKIMGSQVSHQNVQCKLKTLVEGHLAPKPPTSRHISVSLYLTSFKVIEDSASDPQDLMAEYLIRATEEEKLEILSKYQAFVFDLDGTLWKGTQLISGAAEVLDLLRYQVRYHT